MNIIELIFSILILVMSVVIHEVSHGYAAYLQGDQTAKYAGRLTLNPLKHIDPLGSIIVPIFTYFTTGFAFGWAKPVPFNPYNLRNQKWGEMLVAIAGPGSNIVIAVVFSLIIRLTFFVDFLPVAFIQLISLIIIVNIALAIFNLVPIPPLDGSKVLFSILPLRYQNFRRKYEIYALPLLLILVIFFSSYLGVVVNYLFVHLTGIAM